jgi:hypothetical protein
MRATGRGIASGGRTVSRDPGETSLIATLVTGRRPVGILGRVDWLFGQILSFEAAFALFLYSNELKTIIPFPFGKLDETVVFGALAVGAAAIVIYREGIYLRGIPILSAVLVFIGWAVLSGLVWSPSRTLVWKSISYLLTFTSFSVVAGCLIIANRRERAVRFFFVALVISAGMALYGLYIDFASATSGAGPDGTMSTAGPTSPSAIRSSTAPASLSASRSSPGWARSDRQPAWRCSGPACSSFWSAADVGRSSVPSWRRWLHSPRGRRR